MGIKRLEKDPDHKNVYDSLIDDAVGRNKNLWQFACFCSAQESRCSIALDGGWGTGKTFFLNQLKMIFDTYGDQSEQINEDEKNQLQVLFNGYAAEDQLGMTIKHHVCVYYDAWLNDNADDPLHSILYELIKQTKNKFVKNGKGDCWKAACAIFDAFTGKNTSSLVDLAIDTNPIYDVENQKSFHKGFADYLDNLIPERYGRLLVLIDELDRCKPSYAVQLLERIKHYLSNDRITFIFAVNNKELQKTITAFYGDEFDANQYLDRFFDYRLSLPAPSNLGVRKLLKLEPEGNHLDAYKRTCERFIELYSLSLREAIKYRQWVKIVCEARPVPKSDTDAIVWKFIINILIPIVLGLKYKDEKTMKEFLAGDKSSYPLKTIVSDDNVLTPIVHDVYLLFATGTELEQSAFEGIPVDIVEEVYHAIVYPKQKKDYLKQQGYRLLDERFLEEVISASNFMADFIKFDTNTEETAHG